MIRIELHLQFTLPTTNAHSNSTLRFQDQQGPTITISAKWTNKVEKCHKRVEKLTNWCGKKRKPKSASNLQN